MTDRKFLTIGLVLMALVHAGAAGAESGSGPQGREEGPYRRQIWLIPSTVDGISMHTTVMRPPGPGPFPLVVLNHGSTQSAIQRAMLPPPEFPELVPWFLARGYVVALPLRPGHGVTGGPYLEDQYGCDNADFLASGKNTAASIRAVIDYMIALPFVRRNGVIVAGQSAGAWGALALASENPRRVKAVINFAGGRGGRVNNRPNSNCAPDRLVRTAGGFGRSAHLPTLWIYSVNDSYFAPILSRRMADAFAGAGGRVEYHLLSEFGSDGHELATSRGGEPLWAPVLERFLSNLR